MKSMENVGALLFAESEKVSCVIKSLLLKLGMLSMTIGVVFWVRWAPQLPVQSISSTTEKQVVASLATELEERESRTAGSSNRIALTEPSKTAVHSRLDLNRASAGELESLPGIGAVMAQRVIAFRESVGGFRTVEALREVKGIGAKEIRSSQVFRDGLDGEILVVTEQRETMKAIDEQLELIQRGAVEVIQQVELEAKLKRAAYGAVVLCASRRGSIRRRRIFILDIRS